MKDYRGATIEDLDIKPAISVNPQTTILQALETAYEGEFTFLPVIHEANKKLLGVLNVDEVEPKKGELVKNHMMWFSQAAKRAYEQQQQPQAKTPRNTKIITPQPSSKTYTVLTPGTPLEELDAFFAQGNPFAIITEAGGKFVYGVATLEDLQLYEKSRPLLGKL
ncbi:hypothetical protein DIURU_005103 [Diutina rugosa]|uniref:CBS domain-containing protein n=1 Tax=Diutina rugosa TaxID=5481 RepID=A0A642UEP5_DIURU|nr:uncharacterized protein DIURU_005103 [Diutina rugosa]KAA8897672.1 hypothetical protein DIURU_005103 [Diutina rugosa]